LAAGRYALHEVIGEGGMATVFRARDVASGELVALKRLHDKKASEPDKATKARILFEREYHVLSQLTHPRVVRVHDYQVDAQGPLYTMELLDGGDLHGLAPLDWKRACEVMRDVCSVVALLHSRRLIHRDLSPRNVRCTSDGQAKLIDFGAMTPMGPVKQVVGTPPICAPEVVNLEPLDARADLYSLGATLYHAITARHAYPARDFRHLRNLWNEPIAPPSALVKGVPAELDALVMSLLSLNPEARPVSAAEVLDRLSAIAGLPADEQLHVSNAYLCSPTLVGRSASVARVHKKLARALDKRGSSTLVLGDPGVGRSRFFTACVLEAKLLGLAALRADAVDGQRGDYGGVRALAMRLFDNLPEQSLEAARPLAGALGHAIPELLEKLPGTTLETFKDPQQKRPRVQQALREWFIAVSKHKPLLIAIDDVDQIDEPSSALAALLTQDIAKHAIALVVTARSSAAQAMYGAIKVLRDASTRLMLGTLDDAESIQLVGSLFGDVPYVEQLARKMFATAQGNPRDLMELAQHLVDRNAVRYVAGAWMIPAHIDDSDLPKTLAIAHQARIATLGPDALALARSLALSPDLQVTFAEGQLLLGGVDPSRMLRTLDELLVAGILTSSARRFQLGQRGYVPLLVQGIEPDAEREMHARLGSLFESRDDAFRLAQQLLLSGEEDRALDVLVEWARASTELTDASPDAYNRLLQAIPSDWFHTCSRALALCKSRGRPRMHLHTLFNRMSGLSPVGFGDTLAVSALLAQLKHDVGTDLYAGLDPEMEPLARLTKSFELAQQRYAATPDNDRVLEPLAALRPLARACIVTAGWVATRLDVALWSQLPSLKPFEPLSPALGVVDILNQGIGSRITGRFGEARALYEALLERLAQPDRGGLDETYLRYVVTGVNCGLGMIQAPMGLPRALDHAKAIEEDPLHRVNAVLITMLYSLWNGDVRTAEKLKQDVEMLRLQAGGRWFFEGGHLMAEVAAYAACDDLLRIKQTLDGIAVMADNAAGWVPIQHYARGEYHRIRGDHATALSELTHALELARAGEHQMWCEIAAAHLRVLDALGQHEEACELGESYLQAAQNQNLDFGQHTIKLALGCAYAATGKRERAEELASAVIESLEKMGARGLNPGLAYEARARIAVRVGDKEGFAPWARRCAEIYRAANNRALIVKHERLMRESRGADPGALGTLGPATLLTAQAAATHITAALSACPGPRERARLGLDLLVARSGALGGFLYAIEPTGPVLTAQAGLEEPPSGLSSAVAEHLRLDIEEADTTASDAQTAVEMVPPGGHSTAMPTNSFAAFAGIAGEGRELRPCIVGHVAKQRFEITGLAILVIDPTKPFVAPADVASHLSRSWFDSGDVTSITAWLSAMTMG
jgi:tRNA A-37 threonylcarbamoyl transferase component Bud32/tetratricopeptide (TPR) repeat protein